MEMKEIEADDQQNKSSEAAISVAEHDDTSSVRSTIVGTVLAFTSSDSGSHSPHQTANLFQTVQEVKKS